MKMRTVLTLLASATLTVFAQAQEMPKGEILAVLVQGEASIVDSATGQSSELSQGMFVSEGFTIVTGDGDSVTLAFSNGSVININENTSLEIREYRQTAFDADAKGSFNTLEEEPSLSMTQLYVIEGQILGTTKPLNPESSFLVTSDAGTARITGTTWVFTYTGQLTAAVVEGSITVVNNQTGDSSVVPAGNQIVISRDDQGNWAFQGLEGLDPQVAENIRQQLTTAIVTAEQQGLFPDAGVPAAPATATTGPLGGPLGGATSFGAVDVTLVQATEE